MKDKKKKVLIEIGHPAHVHHFKNLYWSLLEKNWEGFFVAKQKECSIDLLEHYCLPYVSLGSTKKGLLNKFLSLPFLIVKYTALSFRYKPNVFISRVSPLSGLSSFILRRPHITFTDTENVKLMDSFSEPFADVILTSTSYLREHGKNQLRYPGYHELAYLHPNRFKPNKNVLSRLGVKHDEKFAIVRFVSWDAHHDIGLKGLSLENKIRLVEELRKYVRVFISSEKELPEQLKQYQIKINPENMHDVLSFATLFVGESATMASECAVLGTPAIYIDRVGRGYTDDQEKHEVVHNYKDSEEEQNNAINKAIELIKIEKLKVIYAEKRDKMLAGKIDVTSFMVWFVENYPDSVEKMKQNDFCFERFK
ncbi:MAG: DUF354 domain-containing protein [Sphaerochaetaceae bacterium]